MSFIADAHQTAQECWDLLLGVIGDDPFNLYFHGTNFTLVKFILVELLMSKLLCLLPKGTVTVSSAVFWTLSLSLLVVDLYKQPRMINQYKVEPTANSGLDRHQVVAVNIDSLVVSKRI